MAQDPLTPAAPDAVLAARVRGPLDRLYGPSGVDRLVAAHVAVVGLGGVGSWVAEGLARSGVGRLTLIDMDHVAPSNLNRQVHALQSNLGQSKVAAMQERVLGFGMATNVRAVDEFVTPENWPALLESNDVDLLIDACDDFTAKLCMAAWALDTGTPCITVGAAGGKKQAHRTRISDLSEVTHDPLLAKLRYTLRKSGGAARTGRIGLVCVSSDESVQAQNSVCAVDQSGKPLPPAAPGAPLACHGYGSSIAVTASFGFAAVGVALNWLCAAPCDDNARPEPSRRSGSGIRPG